MPFNVLEKMYISFMEPSVRRLELEWQVPHNTIEAKVSELTTHTHEEFSELGDLYDRKEVDLEAPYFGLPVPFSARNTSDFEPNYLY